MRDHRGLLRAALAIGCLTCLMEPAWATVDNLKAFKAAYPGKEAKAYSCRMCHNSVVGKKDDHNAYGLSLKELKAPDAKRLTEEDFRAIEQEDADGDGVSNLDEITSGTAPGDPTSVPEAVRKGSEATDRTHLPEDMRR